MTTDQSPDNKTPEEKAPETPEAEVPTTETPEVAGEGVAEEPKATVTQPEGEEPPMAGTEGEAPAAPANPNFLGEMEPGELAMMTTLRQQTRKIQSDVGGLEIQKARLIGNLGQVEQQLEHHLNMVGQRIGLPQGTQFQVSPDGKCYRVPQPGQMPQGLRMVPPAKG